MVPKLHLSGIYIRSAGFSLLVSLSLSVYLSQAAKLRSLARERDRERQRETERTRESEREREREERREAGREGERDGGGAAINAMAWVGLVKARGSEILLAEITIDRLGLIRSDECARRSPSLFLFSFFS